MRERKKCVIVTQSYATVTHFFCNGWKMPYICSEKQYKPHAYPIQEHTARRDDDHLPLRRGERRGRRRQGVVARDRAGHRLLLGERNRGPRDPRELDRRRRLSGHCHLQCHTACPCAHHRGHRRACRVDSRRDSAGCTQGDHRPLCEGDDPQREWRRLRQQDGAAGADRPDSVARGLDSRHHRPPHGHQPGGGGASLLRRRRTLVHCRRGRPASPCRPDLRRGGAPRGRIERRDIPDIYEPAQEPHPGPPLEGRGTG